MEDRLDLLYDNSQTDEFDDRQFRSIMYGALDQNPGVDVFYDVKPSTEARKAEIEAYMAEAFEQGTVYEALGEYGGQTLLYTAKVLAQPEIEVGEFDAGPLDSASRILDGNEDMGQEVPDDISKDFRQGTSTAQRAEEDEEFVDYVLENAVNLEDTLVVKEAPTSVAERFHDRHIDVHRVNDQPLDMKELQRLAAQNKGF